MTRAKRLLQENNAFERQLAPDFNRVLTDVVVYLSSAPVSLLQRELVRRDIAQMLLEGQKRGDRPQDVIGEDYRGFCDQVLAEVPRLTGWERLLEGASTGFLCLGVLGVIWMTPQALENWLFPQLFPGWLLSGDWPMLPVTAGDALAATVILAAACALVRWISHTAFDSSPSSALFVTVFLGFAVGLAASRLLTDILFHIHVGLAFLVILACFLLYKALDWLENR